MNKLKFGMNFTKCCSVIDEALINKAFFIAVPENIEPFLAMYIGVSKNNYNPDTEEFSDIECITKINFCPFCGKELDYEIIEGKSGAD